MESKAQWPVVLLSALTIFVSAFLLFQVQPMISKVILPWFGGSPAVWTTCMLFFQVFLLGGYTYAHLLVKIRRPMWQTMLHMGLLLAAALTLPVNPGDSWKPVDSNQPTLRIMILLAANVGLPYLLLSSTGPLVQAWFSAALDGRSPYRLYSLSNIGSLGALLTYPFLFEPAFSTDMQGFLWSLGFVLFAALCGSLASLVWRIAARRYQETGALTGSERVEAKPEKPDDEPTVGRRVLWLLLPALASMTLIAVTNHVCQDVAPNPFLWVVPLSLYLLTFIICFDREAWYLRRTFAWATAVAATLISIVMIGDVLNPFFGDSVKSLGKSLGVEDYQQWEMPQFGHHLYFEVAAFLTVMFLICMVCHGELVRLKPAPRHLTRFYLMISLGGALGGVFVAVICPLIFASYLETNIAIAGGFVIALVILIAHARATWSRRAVWLQLPAIFVVFLAGLFVAFAQVSSIDRGNLAQARNFYGVLRITEDTFDDKPAFDRRVLLHGRIRHGFQFLRDDRKAIPTTYYKKGTGVALAIENIAPGKNVRVGVVGLGTGTLAVYGREGDVYRFYEINPRVIDFAQRYFSFLKLSKAKVELVLGDARLQMEYEDPQNYDVLVLDAFSGDAIPVHLLTREAFEIYRCNSGATAFWRFMSATGTCISAPSSRRWPITSR